MLAGSLRGVVAQNLLKKKGGGRCAAQEVMIVTPGVASLIREGKTFQLPSQMQVGARYGMILLNDALEKLVRDDKVEPLEAYDRSVDKEDMAKKLKGLGHDIEAMMAREKDEAGKAAQPAPPAPTMTTPSAKPRDLGATGPTAPNQPPPGAQPGAQWKRPGT